MERVKKIKMLALFVLALGFSLASWSQVAVPEAEAIVFTKHTIDGAFDMAYNVHAIDMDNDGDIDVLGAAARDDEIAWWENDGNENFTKYVIAADFHCADDVHAIDLDNDGDIDVLGSGGRYAPGLGREIAWWENDGNENFTKHIIIINYIEAHSVHAIDIDNDGDIDILGSATSELDWWENDGNENFTRHTIDITFVGIASVHAIDIDNDGDIDILGSRFQSPIISEIAWWENDGSENFTRHSITTDLEGARDAYAIDIDNDGDIDVLGAAQLSNEIAWWENDGNENFTKYIIDGSFSGAWGVYATDMDGDSDIDVLGAGADGHEIAWWENDSSENFTKHLIDGSFTRACDVYTTDIDGDGDVDVLGAAGIDDEIAWWEANIPPRAIGCASSYDDCAKPFQVKISWSFDDPGDTQSAYQVQIASSADFVSDLVHDSGKVASSSEWFTTPPEVVFPCHSHFYHWRVRVWDSHDATCIAPWCRICGGLWHTNFPTPDFSYLPAAPEENQVVNFTDLSLACGTTTIDKWEWDFGDGTPIVTINAPAIGDTTHTYGSDADYTVKLTVTNNHGFRCSYEEIITIDPDTTSPTVTTEAWIPDEPTGIFIDNGDIVNLNDIDEAGEKVTIYSNASDDSGIFDQQIKWWRYDSGGALIGGGSGSEVMGDGSYSLIINGPLNDGDRIEYYSEATDTIPNPTAYHPVGSDACAATDPNPCAARYSFTVEKVKTWAKAYGSGSWDIASSVQQNLDGSYIIAGETTGYGEAIRDILITKLDSDGNQQWARTFGGSNWDGTPFIQKTSDGYIVSGATRSYGIGAEEVLNFLIIKLNQDGEQIWARSFGKGHGDELAYSVQPILGGGYIVSGTTVSYGHAGVDFLVVKLDSNGEQVWAKTFGGVSNEIAYSVQQTDDEGFIVSGRTLSYGPAGYHCLVLKLDSSGDQEWAKIFDSFGDSPTHSDFSVQQNFDGDYIIAGSTNEVSYAMGGYDFLILKLDGNNGDLLWAKIYGGVALDYARSLQQTFDGGYIITGATNSYGGGGYDFLVIKLNSNGEQVWAKTFGDTDSEYGYSVQKDLDGGYIVSGKSNASYSAGGYDFLILKMDQNGNIESCSPPLRNLLADDLTNGHACDAGALCSEDISAVIYIGNVSKDNDNTAVCSNPANELCTEHLPKDGDDGHACGAGKLCTETIPKDNDNTAVCAPAGSLCMEDVTPTETDACSACDSTPPTVTTEAYIPDIGTGTEITDGGIINLSDIDGAGEEFTLYSNALDPVPASGIQDQKIKWWHYDNAGTLKNNGVEAWDTTTVPIAGGLNSLALDHTLGFADGDRIEYMSEATDTGGPNTIYDPVNSETCGNTPCGDRYSFTVEKVKTWAKAYGGNAYDTAYSIQQTSDGGYITAGYTYSYSAGADLIVTKTDSSGTEEWTKTFGDAGVEIAWSIKQTFDGGYIVAGNTDSYTGNSDFLVIKLDSAGNKKWSRTFGSAGHDFINWDLVGNSFIQQTDDDGYIITGFTSGLGVGGSDRILVIKINADDLAGNFGGVTWAKTFGSDIIIVPSSIQQTFDGGYIITGWDKSIALEDAILLLRLDSSGNQQWAKLLSGAGIVRGSSIQQTDDDADGQKDDGYIITSWGGIIKINADVDGDFGGVDWGKKFSSNTRSIKQTSDGEYIIAGYSSAYGFGGTDVLIIKINSSGIQQWARTFGDTGDETARSVQQTFDGGYIVAGDTDFYGAGDNDLLVLKLDQNGDIESCSPPLDNPGMIDVSDVTPAVSDIAPVVTDVTAALTVTDVTPTTTSPTLAVINACTGCDATPPTFVTEAKDKNGILIADGGMVDIDDTDTITIESDAQDASGVVDNQKIRYWINGVLHLPVDEWNFPAAGGLHIVTIPGPLNAGDFVEYQIEATDDDLNTGFDPVDGVTRYSFTVVAAAIGQTWAKSYFIGDIHSIQQTFNGEYIAVGETSLGAGNHAFSVVRVDSSGNQKWVKTFGGSSWEYAYSIQQTDDDNDGDRDDGYIVVGRTSSYGNNNDVLILKLDSNGNQEWAKVFGNSCTNFAYSIQQTSDNGYIIAGHICFPVCGAGNDELFVLKLDSNGDQEWAEAFGRPVGIDWSHSIQQTDDDGDGERDDGYVLIGFDESMEGVTVLKLNSDTMAGDFGGVNWTKTFGGADFEHPYTIQQTFPDRGYIIAGTTTTFGVGNRGLLVIKLHFNGGLDWAKVFGDGIQMNNATDHAIQQTTDGGYIITGESDVYGAGDYDSFVLKLDSGGDQQWARTLGGNTLDWTCSIQQTSDNGYIAAGVTTSVRPGFYESLIFKMDQNGNIDSCSPPLNVLNADNLFNGFACDANTLCSEDITAIISTSNLPKDILDPGCTAGSLCNESIPKDLVAGSGCTAGSLCNESIPKDLVAGSGCTAGSLCSEDFTVTETDACAGCNTPPTVTPNAPSVPTNWCASSPGSITLPWAFDDAEDGAGNQTAYQIKLTRNPGGATCDSGKQGSPAVPDSTGSLSGAEINLFAGCTDFIDYGNYTYDWDITVWDSADAPSATMNGTSFGPTPLHQYPTAKFSYDPVPPPDLVQFQNITFDPLTAPNNSQAYGGESIVSFDWDFDGDGTVDLGDTTFPPPADPTIVHSYAADGAFAVDLKVTDSTLPVGYSCWASDFMTAAERTITIGESMPEWNETMP